LARITNFRIWNHVIAATGGTYSGRGPDRLNLTSQYFFPASYSRLTGSC
jgi:hypothetical protein